MSNIKRGGEIDFTEIPQELLEMTDEELEKLEKDLLADLETEKPDIE